MTTFNKRYLIVLSTRYAAPQGASALLSWGCNLSSGSCVMECGLLQSLSLRVIKLRQCIQGLFTTQRCQERHSMRTFLLKERTAAICSCKANQCHSNLQAFTLELNETIPALASFKDFTIQSECFGGMFCLQWPFLKGTLNNAKPNLKQLNQH